MAEVVMILVGMTAENKCGHLEGFDTIHTII